MAAIQETAKTLAWPRFAFLVNNKPVGKGAGLTIRITVTTADVPEAGFLARTEIVPVNYTVTVTLTTMVLHGKTLESEGIIATRDQMIFKEPIDISIYDPVENKNLGTLIGAVYTGGTTDYRMNAIVTRDATFEALEYVDPIVSAKGG